MESIMSDLIPLFRPKSVALIGASSDTKKYGYWTAKSLIDNKFQGEIHLISRSGGEILGQPTYPDILSVPGEVDLAIIAIAPKHILSIIEQCVEKGVKTGIVVSTGFGETGPEGKEIERRMLEIARKGNMRIMGPNCMGMYSSAVSLNASIIDLAPGPMSLVLQSGNFGIDLNFNAKSAAWATAAGPPSATRWMSASMTLSGISSRMITPRSCSSIWKAFAWKTRRMGASSLKPPAVPR